MSATGPVLVPAPDSAGAVRDVTGWPTGVPGLVVAQLPRGAGACAGLWGILHARSGSRLPYCLPDPEAALGLVLAIRGVTDWQQPGDAVRGIMSLPGYKAAVARFRPWHCQHGSRLRAMAHDNGMIA